ncbi:MAG: GNAT family N-acetyltransferase [Acidobacteria bacterium]|nr:GNAT family N-acetyltransferase [Acidobacteriota bacterium]
MNTKIRLATKEDIPRLESLISISVRRLSQDYYNEGQIESALINIFGVDTQLIADETYYIAETEDQICGCGGWSKRKTLFGGDQTKSGEDDLLDPRLAPARIRAFFVHPEFARQGIGSRILHVCEEAALNAGFKELELVATLPGEPFYRIFGYEVVERFEITLPGELVLPVLMMKKEIEKKCNPETGN